MFNAVTTENVYSFMATALKRANFTHVTVREALDTKAHIDTLTTFEVTQAAIERPERRSPLTRTIIVTTTTKMRRSD